MIYNVLSKTKEVFYMNTIKLVIRIILSNMLEKLNLHKCLIIKFFMPVNNLNGAFIFLFVVIDLCHLSKRALSKDIEDLIPVADVIVFD